MFEKPLGIIPVILKSKMAIIERKLKYVIFTFNERTLETQITTLSRDGQEVLGNVTLNKTYLFSAIRFFVSVAQKMTRGFLPWIKKKNKLEN